MLQILKTTNVCSMFSFFNFCKSNKNNNIILKLYIKYILKKKKQKSDVKTLKK